MSGPVPDLSPPIHILEQDKVAPMIIIDRLVGLIEGFTQQLIGIPLDNPLSFVYVALNLLALIFATFFGSGSGV